METRSIGVILNGVTGRMGRHHHLERSILAIRKQGGVKAGENLRLMPEPILTGRNAERLRALADEHGVKWTTDLDLALGDSVNQVFFDSSTTLQRGKFVEMAAAAGKAVYCEKPTAVTVAEALRLAKLCEAAGLKNGVVQDKLWLPGVLKLRRLREEGFFGRILSVRGEFGYWVFTGHQPDQPGQRPSWNYRAEEGGGIIVDMFCHWHYLIENLFGPIASLVAQGATGISQRVDETGRPYQATADDSAYATFLLKDGTVCQFNSSWCTRVRRDDLLTLQVDGTAGSCVAGLREAWTQSLGQTPRPVWNPDLPQTIDFLQGWSKVSDGIEYENAFKSQWELFLKHVALDKPFPWTLREGARGVRLAELGLRSWKQRRWVDVGEL
jgi:predicted dehydrogenase